MEDHLPHSCGRCGARWSGLSPAHCTGCHLTFTGISNFDRHRIDGHCRTPEDVGLVPKARNGYVAWGRPGHWEGNDDE